LFAHRLPVGYHVFGISRQDPLDDGFLDGLAERRDIKTLGSDATELDPGPERVAGNIDPFFVGVQPIVQLSRSNIRTRQWKRFKSLKHPLQRNGSVMRPRDTVLGMKLGVRPV